jgi:disulfide bond formation protein DsbB
MRPRAWFFLVVLACAGLLGFALYKQHVDFVDPCPMCVFQRVIFIAIGTIALLAAIHGPKAAGRWVYAAGIVLGGLAGSAIAGRHLWLQSLPPDQVPDCGMGLNYMIDTLPFTEVLSRVFMGSGECAEVLWTFLGLSMPGWTLLWYIGIAVGTIFVLLKANATKA